MHIYKTESCFYKFMWNSIFAISGNSNIKKNKVNSLECFVVKISCIWSFNNFTTMLSV